MKSERELLKDRIADLEKTLNRLENEWFEYQTIVSRMTVSKLADPRYPFTDWELLYFQTEKERSSFRATMRALQNRLEGKETLDVEQMDVGAVPKEILYAPSKPSHAEVVNILKKVGRQDDKGLIALMNAVTIELESEFGVLASFVLDGVRFVEGQTP